MIDGLESKSPSAQMKSTG